MNTDDLNVFNWDAVDLDKERDMREYEESIEESQRKRDRELLIDVLRDVNAL